MDLGLGLGLCVPLEGRERETERGVAHQLKVRLRECGAHECLPSALLLVRVGCKARHELQHCGGVGLSGRETLCPEAVVGEADGEGATTRDDPRLSHLKDRHGFVLAVVAVPRALAIFKKPARRHERGQWWRRRWRRRRRWCRRRAGR